jgi:hypothetical protein
MAPSLEGQGASIPESPFDLIQVVAPSSSGMPRFFVVRRGTQEIDAALSADVSREVAASCAMPPSFRTVDHAIASFAEFVSRCDPDPVGCTIALEYRAERKRIVKHDTAASLWSQNAKALRLYRRGQVEEAVRLWREAENLPEDRADIEARVRSEICVNLANAFRHEKRPDDALAKLSEHCISIDPSGLAHLQLARTMIDLGDLEDAVPHFEQALDRPLLPRQRARAAKELASVEERIAREHAPSPGAACPGGCPSADRTLAVGALHACAIRGGDVWCWGQKQSFGRPYKVEGVSNAHQVVSDRLRSCAVLEDRSVVCWRHDPHPDRAPEPATTAEDAPDDVLALAAGGDETCALIPSGAIRCWGLREWRDTPGGSRSEREWADSSTRAWAVELNGRPARAIGVGGELDCALLESGEVECWRKRTWYPVGRVPLPTSPIPAPFLRGAVELAVGANQACALTEQGAVKCFGRERNKADGTLSAIPIQLVGLEENVASIAAGAFSCALTRDGVVKCWGQGYGRAPRTVPGLESGVRAVAVSHWPAWACAEMLDATIRCWSADEAALEVELPPTSAHPPAQQGR